MIRRDIAQSLLGGHAAIDAGLLLLLCAIAGLTLHLLRKRSHGPFVDALGQWGEISRSLLNRASILAVFVNTDGSIAFASDRLLRLTGHTSDEVFGRNWFDTFVAPENREEVRRSLSHMSAEAFPQSSEYFIVTRNGERRLIRWMRMVLRDPDGKAHGICSIGEDLTELQVREDRVAHLKEFYERILENIVNGVYVTDAMGRLRYANAAMRERSGILPYEIGDDSTTSPLPRSLAPFRSIYRDA